MPTTEQLTRLPKWAQQHIERLTRDLAHANAKLSVGPEDSNTFADVYSSAPRPLGRDTYIEFRLGDDPERSPSARVCIEDGGLDIMVNTGGGRQMVVLPVVTNRLRVKVIDR